MSVLYPEAPNIRYSKQKPLFLSIDKKLPYVNGDAHTSTPEGWVPSAFYLILPNNKTYNIIYYQTDKSGNQTISKLP